MKIIKENKYLIFEAHEHKGRKTKIVHIVNKASGEEIGLIEWYSAWRQYCFSPERFDYDTVWNNSCLADVLEVLNQLMKERTIIKPGEE